MLAAYPTRAIPEHTKLLSVYGSNDTVLDKQAYEDARAYWPSGSNELVIEGGNHAQFGSYGEQAGDSAATVSADAQRNQTVDVVVGLSK